VLDLLLDRETGAGASIVRIGIGSSTDDVYDHMKAIQPTDPGGPDAPPQYVWDGDDGAQVWFTKQAHRYGVRRFFADAWSAPGYMKTNGSDSNGGELCTGTADVDTSFRTDTRIHRAATYLTDETHSVARVSNVRLPGTRVLPVHLPARSLTTLVLRCAWHRALRLAPRAAPGTARCAWHRALRLAPRAAAWHLALAPAAGAFKPPPARAQFHCRRWRSRSISAGLAARASARSSAARAASGRPIARRTSARVAW
jgi:hypothetical protein